MASEKQNCLRNGYVHFARCDQTRASFVWFLCDLHTFVNIGKHMQIILYIGNGYPKHGTKAIFCALIVHSVIHNKGMSQFYSCYDVKDILTTNA